MNSQKASAFCTGAICFEKLRAWVLSPTLSLGSVPCGFLTKASQKVFDLNGSLGSGEAATESRCEYFCPVQLHGPLTSTVVRRRGGSISRWTNQRMTPFGCHSQPVQYRKSPLGLSISIYCISNTVMVRLMRVSWFCQPRHKGGIKHSNHRLK